MMTYHKTFEHHTIKMYHFNIKKGSKEQETSIHQVARTNIYISSLLKQKTVRTTALDMHDLSLLHMRSCARTQTHTQTEREKSKRIEFILQRASSTQPAQWNGRSMTTNIDDVDEVSTWWFHLVYSSYQRSLNCKALGFAMANTIKNISKRKLKHS